MRDAPAPTDLPELMSNAAWGEFCDRLKAIGERLLGPEFPATPRGRAEGYDYLGQLISAGFKRYLRLADPDFPVFSTQYDHTINFAGPNIDNRYLRAVVRPDHTYRIWGSAAGAPDILIDTRSGDHAFGNARVHRELALENIEVEADGSFEVFLSAHEQPRNWLPLDPEANHVHVRQYLIDWENDRAEPLYIENLTTLGTRPTVPEPQALLDALDLIPTFVDGSLTVWNDHPLLAEHPLRVARASLFPVEANVLPPPRRHALGRAALAYSTGNWDLADDECLLLAWRPPTDATYWNVQAYSQRYFQALDHRHRLTTYNHTQATVDPDGMVRMVVAGSDPGIRNWLDSERRPGGYIVYRQIGGELVTDITCQVLPFDDLPTALGPAATQVDANQRREQLTQRQRQAAHDWF